MKLAFAIATIAALHQATITLADCGFGSNYTKYINNSVSCSFDVGIGVMDFRETNTISSGDTNVTTTIYRDDMAIWKMDDKDTTVQCYSDILGERVVTSYPNGSTFTVFTGDFPYWQHSVNTTVADGVPLSFPGFYYFQGGRFEFWRIKIGNSFNVTKAEGDITDLCEVLDGAAPAPTPISPTSEAPSSGKATTEAPSSGQMATVTIIPCVAAAILNYFFS